MSIVVVVIDGDVEYTTSFRSGESRSIDYY